MERGREVRAFDYVNRPYAKVREELMGEVLELFRAATRSAATRAHDVAAGLHVNVGGLALSAPIAITVTGCEEEVGDLASQRVTRIQLEWEAAQSPRLFPLMQGTLSAYALTGTETQLDFEGRYQVPGGALGEAMDAVVGHRVAEATVHRFVSDVAEHLRQTLA